MKLIITVKVVPQSGKQRWALDKNGQLKCYLKNPAEKGAANAELIKTIAKIVGISQDKIEIVTGITSRLKRIKIDCLLTQDQFLTLLGLEKVVQQNLF